MILKTPCWTSQELFQILDCPASGEWSVYGISIDTRTLQSGDLFIALEGPTHDGHDYVARAFEKGATAAIVSRNPDGCADDAQLLMVTDTVTALESLGKAARARTHGMIVAITGSVGKTGTKEMLRQALSVQGKVSASTGNLNNHYGVPLSLARMKADTDFGIFEVGMNHAGEIRSLVKMIRPHVSIITAIEAAHTEHFDSVEQIADAKAEIFEGFDVGGIAILNHDSSFYDRLRNAAEIAGADTVIDFGSGEDAQVKLISVDTNEFSSKITILIDGLAMEYELLVPGMHHVMNSLAVLAAVSIVGGDIREAAIALRNFRPLKGRGVRTIIKLDDKSEVTLIDESYNASPAAMHAALSVVGLIKPLGSGRRIAVLGDMLELGDVSSNLHVQLIEHLEKNKFDLVFACGQHMLSLWNELPQAMRGGYSISPEKLSMVVNSSLSNGDVVVVKGSLGSRVGVIVEAILELGEE